MIVMDAVRRWLLECPALENARLDIDCLGSSPGQFSVDGEPTEAVIAQYLDGSSIRRMSFCVASREFYGQDVSGQTDNLTVFDTLADWVNRQNFVGNLPKLGDNRLARSLRVTTTAYPMIVDPEKGTARYQVSCELIYLQEGFYSHETV